MSALTDRIAAGHQLKWLPPEHAVREQVARDIEAAHTDASSWVAEQHLAAWQAALAAAARIARGGVA